MNRQRIERIRRVAQQDADHLKGLGGDEYNGPATPMEAYRRAGWFASTWVADLCSALLSDDATPSAEGGWLFDLPEKPAASDPFVCALCGRTLRPGEMVQYGGVWRQGRGMSQFGIRCAEGRCQADYGTRQDWLAAAENWSA